jgi:eukaryotic-like serine/threonine-protein kinase
MILNDATRTSQDEEDDLILSELIEQFIDRLQAGERVDSRAFATEHPTHAEALLELLPAAATMARLRRSTLRPELPSTHFRLDSDAIGGYRIVREVGRGGMGVVYEAEQVASGRRVALKVLPISSVTDSRQIERFRIEGQASAALDHPHIVPVFEIGCEQGVHFYAMQFIEGSSLAALVHQARSSDSPKVLTPRGAARLALQAAEALAHAHDLGIVHRDVKPANLLVDPTGHLWVADFGLARFLDGGDLTQTGDVIGTLRYLSPEQARGRRKLDARTDVYSLGATLYELATLRPAFDGQDRQELLRQIADDEPIPPRRLDPTIPRDLETILASAMAKEVDDRYGSAGDFADDLRRFLGDRPILARRPDAPTRVARWARRNRAAVSVATVVLALFLLGTGVGVALLWREQVRTRENLRVALTALDEFCLSTTAVELTRDPERTQEAQDLQLKALTIYERMLRQNPSDPEARWAAARAEHRVANILARSPRATEAEPAYRAAHQNLTLLLSEDPKRLAYRQEAADVLGDWGATLMAGKPETRELRRRALSEHLRLAAEFSAESKHSRAVSRDCLEVAKSIGITDPAEAVEKEALFRRAVTIRSEMEDRSFEGKAELAEALAYLGHMLNATRRAGEGGEVMTRGRDLLATLDSDSAGQPLRRHRVLELERLFTMPRYCDPSPKPDETLQAYQSVVDGQARLVAEFPFIPEFRAELAWGHHALASTLTTFDRNVEAVAGELKSVRLLEELIRDHPSVNHYRREAASAYEALGDLLSAADHHGDAQAHFRRAIEVIPDGQGQRMRARIAEKLGATGPFAGDQPSSKTR